LAWFSPEGGLEEIGIEPQSGDHTDMAADRGEQIKSGEAAVANDNQPAVRQPAFRL
jgi:hypothetical protein